MVARFFQTISVLLVLSVSTPGWAQDVDTAKQEYKAGWKLLQKKRYEAALEHYEISYRISPRPRTLFNIALCYEGMGATNEAIERFQMFIKTAEARDAEFLAEARAKLKALKSQIGAEVLIESVPSGAAIVVDGTVRGHTPLRLQMAEGQHLVQVRRRGARSSTKRIDVTAGEDMVETFHLDAVGRVRLTATPADAVIRRKGVDDVEIGRYEADLSPGHYEFEVSLAGYHARALALNVKANDRIDKSIRLQADRDTAEVIIRSDIRNVNISIDGLIVGSTRNHDGTGPALERRLVAGHHVLIAESRSGKSWSKRVHLSPGETLSVDLTFRKRTNRDIASWTFSAIGTTSLVAGVTLGVLGISDLRSDSESQNDRGQSRVTTAAFLAGLGAAGLLGGRLLKGGEPAAHLERSHE